MYFYLYDMLLYLIEHAALWELHTYTKLLLYVNNLRSTFAYICIDDVCNVSDDVFLFYTCRHFHDVTVKDMS